MNSVRLSSLTSTLSLVILGILYSNFASVCILSISCSSYLPTLSYLSTFRFHDLVTLLALTLLSFSLVPVFVSWHLRTQGRLALDELLMMVLLELSICVLTITIGIIDETNGIEFNPVDNLHHFLSFSLCAITIVWVFYALKFLEISGLSRTEIVDITICWTLYKVGLVFAAITLYQWHFAYTIYSNWFTNPFVESVCEWILVTITIRFPCHLCRVTNYTLDISVKDKIKN